MPDLEVCGVASNVRWRKNSKAFDIIIIIIIIMMMMMMMSMIRDICPRIENCTSKQRNDLRVARTHYVIQYDQREVCGFVGYVLLKYVNVGGRPTMRTFVIYFQYARYFSMQGRQQAGSRE